MLNCNSFLPTSQLAPLPEPMCMPCPALPCPASPCPWCLPSSSLQKRPRCCCPPPPQSQTRACRALQCLHQSRRSGATAGTVVHGGQRTSQCLKPRAGTHAGICPAVAGMPPGHTVHTLCTAHTFQPRGCGLLPACSPSCPPDCPPGNSARNLPLARPPVVSVNSGLPGCGKMAVSFSKAPLDQQP